jgi:hypothetical protein
MKIIREGKALVAPDDWWVGYLIDCPCCRTVVQLEAGDNVEFKSERRIGGRRTVSGHCPICQGVISADNSRTKHEFLNKGLIDE